MAVDGGGAEFSGESSVGDGVVGVEPEVFGFVVVHTDQDRKSDYHISKDKIN